MSVLVIVLPTPPYCVMLREPQHGNGTNAYCIYYAYKRSSTDLQLSERFETETNPHLSCTRTHAQAACVRDVDGLVYETQSGPEYL